MIAMTSTVLSIGELSHLTGLSTHAIRFYEAAGVLNPARRASNGHRRYHSDDILWLEFVLKLKLTGMPLAEIKTYALLRAQGELTLPPRLAMLKLHRERLVNKMTELLECTDVLDEKIRVYRKMIAKAKVPTKKANR